MRRVAIVGYSGGGKSSLARRLAEKTGLPLVHIDQEYWRPDWVEPPFEQWRARHADLIAAPAWIIDGNSTRTLPARSAAADTLVYLDMPRWRCLLQVLWRVVTSHGRVREDMAPGCPERFDAAFLRYIWAFKRRYDPVILAVLEDRSGALDTVHLRSWRQAERWLEQVSEGAGHDATL